VVVLRLCPGEGVLLLYLVVVVPRLCPVEEEQPRDLEEEVRLMMMEVVREHLLICLVEVVQKRLHRRLLCLVVADVHHPMQPLRLKRNFLVMHHSGRPLARTQTFEGQACLCETCIRYQLPSHPRLRLRLRHRQLVVVGL
jgi:hypothetical protein